MDDMFSPYQRDDALKLSGDRHASDHTTDGHNVADMEDFGNIGKNPAVRNKPIVQSYGINNNDQHQVKTSNLVESTEQNDMDGRGHKQSIHTVQKVYEESIDKSVDYQGWLELRKRKWKEAREKRKRQRLDNSRTPHLINGTEVARGVLNYKPVQGRVGVSSYFQRHDLAITRCHWQIIQLVPSAQYGQFFAWVVVEGTMLKIPIIVPRVFYLNSKAPVTEEFPGRRVNKILPHGHQSYNLIEVVIDEDQFRAESKKLAAHLADPEVEGIYETKIPLEFNAILQIGCVCKVDKSIKKRNLQEGWNLSELHMKTTTECPYLEHSISFFYLYHSISDGRAIYVAYFPGSSQISVVVVSPFPNKELSSQMLERQFREACQASSFQPPMPYEGITFKVDYVGNVKDAQTNLQRMITGYRHRHHGPIIGVVECPNVQLLKSGIRALEDFPCVRMPSNVHHSQYQAIGWQVLAAKNGIQRCVVSSQWLNERIALSRYAHVPLGNFEVDYLIHTADIFFSRALHDQQQVLWISNNGIPDLGGTNEEVPCFIDEATQPTLTYPGAYRKVAVELKIHHLAVSALLKSNQVNEMEGGALFGLDQELNPASYNSDKQYSFDVTTSCTPAFRVLKQLIQRCLADVITSGNVFADTILQHLYRWICSPKSKLHDPALHRMLHKVMQKIFALLIAELRKLGATIVFASFGKVIIDTGKSDISAAKAYCESVLKTLHTRDLFDLIELEPFQFWHSLLFMDQYNYGGIQGRLGDGAAEEYSKASTGIMQDGAEVDIVSSWTIAENLPKAMQDHFILIVSEFLYFPWKYAQEEAAKRASAMDDMCTPSITASTAEILGLRTTEFLKKKIGSDFTDKLLKIVCDPSLHMKGRHKSLGDHNATGSLQALNNIHRGDSPLDFIKYVCGVLALDQTVQHEVLIMRRNLLKLVRIREFAPEAEFHRLSMSLVLPNVICSYCCDCRDLDLGRDKALTGGQEWRCAVPQCGQPYDREVMENALLQIVRQRERLYHLQDLVCLKCNQIKAAHLSEHCTCAGSFVCKEDSSEEFCSKMQIFLNVAVDQKFQLLQECASWILQLR
ncbi:DNA-directed DNA polymerase [Handroanthus impetiginosus]|uniref:DNA polymerase epsilon catalytic subunit n=1 Tax=Handroanthus impetiginosus TaxID=429701 RepID=A0A2G9GVA6_9LAMI|nr:DNA-directed DNA polymerase [Handroanthus impetiginosus]